jgi:hypothetical protein
MPSVLYAAGPEIVWVYATPFRKGRWGVEQVGHNRPRDPEWEGRALPTDALPNAAVYRRDLLRSIGGWDRRMAFGCTADMCQRIKASGSQAWADSRAFIYHDVELPGQLGSWSQHAVDPVRLRQDIHDWNLFLRQLHGDGVRVRFEVLAHTAPSNAVLLASLTVRRRGSPLGPLLRAFAEGMRSGLTEPVGPAYVPVG